MIDDGQMLIGQWIEGQTGGWICRWMTETGVEEV